MHIPLPPDVLHVSRTLLPALDTRLADLNMLSGCVLQRIESCVGVFNHLYVYRLYKHMNSEVCILVLEGGGERGGEEEGRSVEGGEVSHKCACTHGQENTHLYCDQGY